MRRTLCALIFACLVSAFGQRVPAADLPLPDHPRYAIEHFGDHYGLGAITVLTLAQDRQGFLWIGTLTGVYRYDGSNVKRFGVSEGLPSVHTYQLIASADGGLWVRTRKGIARFEGQRFVPVPIPGESGGLSERPQSFAVDNAGNLFALTERGLLRIDGQTGGSRLYGPAEGLPPARIEAIVRGPDDSIWFATGHRIGCLPPGSREPIIFSSPVLPADAVEALIVDGRGRLWVRTLKRVAFFDPAGKSPRELVFDDQGIPPANDYGGPTLDRHGNLMLPTSIGLYRRVGERWQLIDRKNGLTSSALYSTLEDREGTIWIGLAGAGLDRWPGSNQWSGWTDAEGLPDPLVLSVLRDQRNRLWVGANTVTAMWEPGQHHWIAGNRTNGVPDMGTVSILQTRDGAVWTLSGRGVMRTDASGSNLAAMLAPLPKDSAPITSIAAAPDDSVWVSDKQGLRAIRYSGGRFSIQDVSIPRENRQTTAVLSFSPRGILWTGGRNGISRFDGVHWKRFDQADGLLASSVRNVHALSDGEAWIGYPDEGSVTRARLGPEGRLVVEHFKKGVCVLGMDRDKNVWLEMEQSVGVLSPADTIQNFTQNDGLIWNDVNCDAFWQEADGTILIGTSHGLARFDPSQEGLPRTAPTVVLTGARFADQDRLQAANPVVPFAERTFTAQFAALAFRHSDQISCKYRLRGLENDFTETFLREARYSALPPGEYTFEVACGSPEMGWSKQPAAYSFIVQSPWWRRWWVQPGALILLVLLVWGVTLFRTRRLESERKRLEAAVAARSAELATANRELQEASLTDPLTGVRNRRFFYSTIPADASQAIRAYRGGPEGYSRDHRDLVFYLVDLDQFKQVNDLYGHDVGDQMLVEVARRLGQIVRQSDFLIRWGGEEFLILCRSAERRDAPIFAEKILAAVAEEPFTIASGKMLTRTCSVGWAPYPWMPGSNQATSVDGVLKLADRALYRAKEHGRNQAVGVLPAEMSLVPAGPDRGDYTAAEVREVISPGPGSS